MTKLASLIPPPGANKYELAIDYDTMRVTPP